MKTSCGDESADPKCNTRIYLCCQRRALENLPGYKTRTPQNHAGNKQRALPGVEGLLE